jgi:hypothetical protein
MLAIAVIAERGLENLDLMGGSRCEGAREAALLTIPRAAFEGGARTFFHEGSPLLWLLPIPINSSATIRRHKNPIKLIISSRSGQLVFTDDDTPCPHLITAMATQRRHTSALHAPQFARASAQQCQLAL